LAATGKSSDGTPTVTQPTVSQQTALQTTPQVVISRTVPPPTATQTTVTTPAAVQTQTTTVDPFLAFCAYTGTIKILTTSADVSAKLSAYVDAVKSGAPDTAVKYAAYIQTVQPLTSDSNTKLNAYVLAATGKTSNVIPTVTQSAASQTTATQTTVTTPAAVQTQTTTVDPFLAFVAYTGTIKILTTSADVSAKLSAYVDAAKTGSPDTAVKYMIYKNRSSNYS